MRKAEDILRDLAFNKEAPESTKQAFLKNLQKAMCESDKGEVIPVTLNRSQKDPLSASTDAQLSFDLGTIEYLPKKQSS